MSKKIVKWLILNSTRRRFDYVNIVQGLLDAMVAVGYVEDDSAEYVIPVFEPYEIDHDNPRTEVVVI